MEITTLKQNARKAGIFYFLQIPLGVFGIMYVPKFIVVNNDIVATLTNFIQNESTIRWSILSSILCALITIATAYFIHKTFEGVNRKLSLTMLFFTIIVAPLSIFNEIHYLSIFHLIETHAENGKSISSIYETCDLLLKQHHLTTQTINLFFGLWLLPMGILVIKSFKSPNIIGYLLLITCIGYLVDWTCFIVNIKLPFIVSEFTWLGELLMVLWLLNTGFKRDKIIE